MRFPAPSLLLRFAVPFGVLAAPAALAQPDPEEHAIDQQLGLCLDEDPSTHGMLRCLATAYDAWDAEMNRAYEAVMAGVDAETRTALRDAQRRWLAFRDAELAALDAFYARQEGTMWLVIHADRTVDLVRRRAGALRDYAWVLQPEGE
jgi:uncharacterized protein YecT (DUF1311 family)